MRALRTRLAWANVTIDANLTEYALIIVVIRGRVSELPCVFELAPQRDCQAVILRVKVDYRTVNSAADGEKSVAVRQLNELRYDHTGQAERHVHLPYRAGTSVFGEVEGGRVEPLSDVACFVDPKKKERDTLRARAL